MKHRAWFVSFCLVALAPTAVSFAHAEAANYPDRPVKVVLPLAAGSGGDIFGRFFADQLAASLGRPFVVENQPGGNGIIGAMATKRAPADGYTLLQGTSAIISLNAITTRNLPYDSEKDFKPVHGLVRGMNVILVSSDSPWRTLDDLVAAAKKAPAPLSVGTFSQQYQISQEWFAAAIGSKFNNIPYKGGGAVITDLIGRQIDLSMTDLVSSIPLIKAGKVRALAVSGETRHASLPDVPTVRESGYPDFVNYSWASFYVRAETPDDIVAKLADAIDKIMATKEAADVAARMGGVEYLRLGPAAMRKFQLEESERFKRIAVNAGIKPE